MARESGLTLGDLPGLAPLWVTEAQHSREPGGWRDCRGGAEGVGMLWTELLQDVTWGHAASPEPTARALTGAPHSISSALPPQAFCLQVQGPHSSCFSSKPHVHLRSRGLWSPCGHSPSPRKRGAPCERDPPGKGRAHRDSGPSTALTGSPGSAAPRSCAPPDAGCGCYGDACVGGEACQGWTQGRMAGAGGQTLSSGNSQVSKAGATAGYTVSASYQRKKPEAWPRAGGGGECGRDSHGREQIESKPQHVLPIPNGKSASINTETGPTPAQYRNSSSTARTDRSSEQRPRPRKRAGASAEAQL